MKKLSPFFLLVLTFTFVRGQNVGIGVNIPQAKLQVGGNLMVTEASYTTSLAPTAGQTTTMTNATNVFIASSDSTTRVYDPGGPAGNYLPSLSATVQFSSAGAINIGMEVIIESIGLGTGDSVIIRENAAPGSAVVLAVGNGYSTTGRWVFQGNTIFVQFKSNADAGVGTGFSILVRRIYSLSPAAPSLSGYSGYSFLFDSKTGSLRSGIIGNSERGDYSVAFGRNATASGIYAIAMGYQPKATESFSVAIGQQSEATGANAIAMGFGAIASAVNSSALGFSSTATGSNSIALGGGRAEGPNSTATGSATASGNYSTATGNASEASGTASTAMGGSTVASGQRSFAVGQEAQAHGSFSSAIGLRSLSMGYAGTAIGMYNNPLTLTAQTNVSSSTPLFIIGNGNSESDVSNALVVRKDGRVGIGTNSPVANLHIDNGTDASQADVSGYMVIGNAGSTNIVFDNNEIMARNNGAAATLFLQENGGGFEVGGTAAKPGGGSWSATSDARLKQNVTPYIDGLEQVLKIQPVNFHYNDLSGYDTAQQHVGVLAQDLKEVSPYMVTSFKKDNTDYYKVDNSAMTYMLINAVKEQQKLIEQLNDKIEKLEKKLEAKP